VHWNRRRLFEAVLLSGISPTRMTGTDADVLVPNASTGSVPDDEADPDLSVMAGSRRSLGTYEVNEEGCGSWPTHVGVAGSPRPASRDEAPQAKGPTGEGGPHIQDEAPLQDRRVALGGRVLPSGSTLPNLPPRCTNEGWALSKGDPANNLRGFAPQVLRA
jgi:hypothetical protein